MADYWTIQTLNNADGINKYHEQTVFTFPTGQNGALAGKHITVSGGATNLAFNTQSITYSINRSGMISLCVNLVYPSANGNTGTPLLIRNPYTPIMSATASPSYTTLAVGIADNPLSIRAAGISSVCYLADSSTLQDDDFVVSSTCRFRYSIIYKAF